MPCSWEGNCRSGVTLVNAKMLCFHFHSSDLTTLMLLVVRQQEHLAVPNFFSRQLFVCASVTKQYNLVLANGR